MSCRRRRFVSLFLNSGLKKCACMDVQVLCLVCASSLGSARRTILSRTVDSHGVSAHLLERVLRVCMDVSITTLSCGVLHTSLVMTVWHHMTGIFIRIHHRHRHQRNKKQNSLRSQRKFSRSFRFEPSARTYEIGSNHFNRVGSGGRGFMGFLGVRWFVRVSVVTWR